MNENALLAAREIIKFIDAGCEESGVNLEDLFPGYSYDGIALRIENIIAYQYGEEPRDDAIPFTDD